MKDTLQYLFDYKTLGKEDAKVILRNMAAGKYNEAEMAAFISVYLMRSITVEELAGFRDALLELCTPVDLSEFNTIDVCGTGGDEKNTFNISTLTSFVVAGAGEKVAKHGNYSVSSACGSSNVLEYFGYTFSSDPDRLRREIDQFNICFLHAPLFNPAMKNVAPVRRSLRIKTFFNKEDRGSITTFTRSRRSSFALFTPWMDLMKSPSPGASGRLHGLRRGLLFRATWA